MQTATKGVRTDIRKALSETQSLSDRQLLFVTAFLEGSTKAEAARIAGYSHPSAMQAWRSAKVQQAIAMLMDRFLTGEAAPAAIRALYQLVNDEKQAGGIRVQAANSLLDRAGFTAKRHEIQAASTKDTSTMTRDELQAEIERLSLAIDQRMKDVTPDGVPNDEPIDQQTLDMYG